MNLDMERRHSLCFCDTLDGKSREGPSLQGQSEQGGKVIIMAYYLFDLSRPKLNTITPPGGRQRLKVISLWSLPGSVTQATFDYSPHDRRC